MKKISVFSAILKSAGYVLMFFICQLAADLISEGVIMFTLLRQNLSQNDFVQAAMNAQSAMIYETATLSALLFVGIVLVLKRKKFANEIKWKKASPLSVFTGLSSGFSWYLIASVLMIVCNAIPAVRESQNAYAEQYALIAEHTSLWAEILYVCLIGPVFEEILCRGLIQSTLHKATTPSAAIFLSALTFSLIHGNLYQMVFTLPLGIAMGYLVYRFDSIFPSIALHIAFNGSNYLIRIGSYFGYGENSTEFMVLYYAALLFCLFAVPISTLLLKEAQKKHPLPAEEKAPEIKIESYQGETMASPEYLIVGLGNPGDKYTENRHNCGFMAMDYISLRENIQMKNLRFRSLTGETVIDGKKVILLKPQTFMNLSGEAVRECAAFYKIPPEKILVIFDDVSFQPGIFRIREKGSAGSHNGIKSIISCLGSDAFPRIKIGVGNPPEGWEMMNWVLGNPSPEDQKKIIASLEDVYQTAKLFVSGDLQKAAQLYNGKKHE